MSCTQLTFWQPYQFIGYVCRESIDRSRGHFIDGGVAPVRP